MGGEQGIVLKLGASSWRLRGAEADVLTDWLRSHRSLAAGTLAESIEEQRSITQRPLTLGLDDIAAVRSVLCGADLGDYHGLIALQDAVC